MQLNRALGKLQEVFAFEYKNKKEFATFYFKGCVDNGWCWAEALELSSLSRSGLAGCHTHFHPVRPPKRSSRMTESNFTLFFANVFCSTWKDCGLCNGS